MRLFSYKLSSDTGFAPNPFHGCCTLATCKPQIRRCKGPGDWIAGFTSGQLNGDPVGAERLVYLMHVCEKLPLETYFGDPRFQAKIPNLEIPGAIAKAGDNIYRPVPGGFEQLPNRFHTPEKDHAKDTGGLYALVAERFHYFGGCPLQIPAGLRPDLPEGQAGHGRETREKDRIAAFLTFVARHGKGVVAAPTCWPRGDESWRQQ